MKCVYIGDFEQPYSTENYVADGLEKNGVEVIKFQQTREYQIKDLLQHIIDLEPDFVLFCKVRSMVRGDLIIQGLKNQKILTVAWLFDLYFDLPIGMSPRTLFDPEFRCDLVFTTDGGHDEQWPKKNINHRLLRQGIYESEAVLGKKIPNRAEIIFVGTDTYFARHKLLVTLKQTYGDRFQHYGQGGTREVIRGLDLNNLLASVRVVVGDSVPVPGYWSNRVYEIIGRGGFLIHPKVLGLEKEFEYYKHFVPYDYGNFEQVQEIIDYYCTHDQEREKIRLAGFKFCKQNYTYQIRCQTLIQEVKKNIGMTASKSIARI